MFLQCCYNPYLRKYIMARICRWRGASGKEYIYEIHPFEGTIWSDVPANYIFAKLSKPHTWKAIYIGETESLKNRVPNHNELPCIRSNQGTHVHAHINRDSQARLAEEKDLLSNHSTSCNV
jgi:hypothetical protein